MQSAFYAKGFDTLQIVPVQTIGMFTKTSLLYPFQAHPSRHNKTNIAKSHNYCRISDFQICILIIYCALPAMNTPAGRLPGILICPSVRSRHPQARMTAFVSYAFNPISLPHGKNNIIFISISADIVNIYAAPYFNLLIFDFLHP